MIIFALRISFVESGMGMGIGWLGFEVMVNGLLLEEGDDGIASMVVDLIGLGGVSRDTDPDTEAVEDESIGS